MPRATEGLTRASSQEEVDAAIGSTIAELRRAGRDSEEASAIAFAEARRKTGRSLRRGRRGRNRRSGDLATRERAGLAVMETLGNDN